MLTWNWYVSTHTYVGSENIPFSTKTPLILPMSAFFCKRAAFLTKIVPLLKAMVQYVNYVRDFSVMFSGFVR